MGGPSKIRIHLKNGKDDTNGYTYEFEQGSHITKDLTKKQINKIECKRSRTKQISLILLIFFCK